jgi:hypothetical protein
MPSYLTALFFHGLYRENEPLYYHLRAAGKQLVGLSIAL